MPPSPMRAPTSYQPIRAPAVIKVEDIVWELSEESFTEPTVFLSDAGFYSYPFSKMQRLFSASASVLLLLGSVCVPARGQAPVFTGTITTVAGPGLPVNGAQAITQPIDFPTAAVPDNSGGFYIVSNTQNKIYRVAADGTLTIVAGTGDYGFSGDGGPATSAHLASPNSVALDAAGNLYIADTDNDRIRK